MLDKKRRKTRRDREVKLKKKKENGKRDMITVREGKTEKIKRRQLGKMKIERERAEGGTEERKKEDTTTFPKQKVMAPLQACRMTSKLPMRVTDHHILFTIISIATFQANVSQRITNK